MVKTIIFAMFIAVSSLARASDDSNGKELSSTCAACHGDSGVSANDLWPNLAGQKKQYLILQLKAFRSGTRSDPLMSPISKMLSDKEILDLADFYSQLRSSE